MRTALRPGDALLIVDMQGDFVTGSLAVGGAPRIVPVLNRYIAHFRAAGLRVLATRDWHPPNHMSFRVQGGEWPVHCVAGTPGARFACGLDLDPETLVVSKGTAPEREAYSAFAATGLERLLARHGIRRLFVGGLATDYCVLNTVEDALGLGFEVFLLVDAIRGVNRLPDDSERAVEGMVGLGARRLTVEEVAESEVAGG